MQQTVSVASLPARSIALSTGVTLEYVEHGSPSRIPVLLLHGLSDSLRSYELALPYLPDSIRAFALSQRGHGDSGRPATGYSPVDFAADVAAFLDAFQIERAVIVGHSMGSSIARRFALDYPERLLGLVLVGSFATLDDKPGVVELAQLIAEFRDPIDPAFVAEFQQSTLAQPVSPEFFNIVVQESLKVPAHVWRGVLDGLMGPGHPTDVRSIQAPTLIVWGDQDAFCPRSDQDALLAAIAGSQLVAYTGVGHDPQWEQPERFAADLTAFVQRIAQRG